MARPVSARQRQQQREQRQQNTARSAAERSLRRRQIIAGIVVAGLLLSSGGAIVAVALGSFTDDPTPVTSSVPTRPSVTAGAPAELDFPAAGDTASGPLPCPLPDGASPRTTSFVGPPPICLATTATGAIDTAVNYRVTMTTSAGDLTWLLTTKLAPEAINSFVFLAGYGYWDGAPFDLITPLAWAEVGGAFTADTGGGTGWDLAPEAPEGGMISTPGLLSMTVEDNGRVLPGRLQVSLGDGAASLPEPTTFFGVLLDGSPTLRALQQAGSPTGIPTGQVLVERIQIEPVPAS